MYLRCIRECQSHLYGFAAGTIQLNASVGNLSAQYLIANQPALTIRSSFFSSLVSYEITGPSTSVPVSSQSANTSDPGAPDIVPTSSLLNSAAPTANQSTPMINQSAPLIISNTTVHIVDSVFDSNQHFDFGGMITMNGAAVTVSNTRFSNLRGRVAGAALITSGSLVMFDEGTSLTGNAGMCLAGAVLVNADSALYLDSTTFANNQANGDRGGGAVLLYGNSTLHAVHTNFTQNAATAANLNPVDAVIMAAGGTPSDVAVPTQWCGAVGGVAGIDTLYGIDDLASNHLLGSGEYIHIMHAQQAWFPIALAAGLPQIEQVSHMRAHKHNCLPLSWHLSVYMPCVHGLFKQLHLLPLLWCTAIAMVYCPSMWCPATRVAAATRAC